MGSKIIALDFTQMVMDIQKQHMITIFFIPNNFRFNNIAKKSFPETPQGQCPTPGCPRLWTSPRWLWTSINNLKELFSSYLTTCVLSKMAKKSFPGTPQGQCPTLGCLGLWTPPRCRKLIPGCPRECLFGNVVETKVVGYNETSYLR